jgi:hypothetical protein
MDIAAWDAASSSKENTASRLATPYTLPAVLRRLGRSRRTAQEFGEGDPR